MIELAYIGVHEIFQMAIAAEEMQALSGLQCSLFDKPGSWGRRVLKHRAVPSAFPIGSEMIPPGKVHEIPWPLMAKQLAQKISRQPRFEPLPYHQWFEKHAAKRLRKTQAKVAVGAETCALAYFREAHRLDMKCMLDSHGIPAPFLDESLARAADEFGLPAPPRSDSQAMTDHKVMERELAHTIVFCSELQKRLWVKLGVPEAKCQVSPLWVDCGFWHPLPEIKKTPLHNRKLRAVAVGAGSLAKGLPYLLQAWRPLAKAVELHLVGGVAESLKPMLNEGTEQPHLHGYMSRPQLREMLNQQDVLIMPSLGDSFGFVAVEAMACGLPVIVTEHCGVPVPDASWRVPAHDALRIRECLQGYLDDPAHLENDSEMAKNWAAQQTPNAYRQRIQRLYQSLLCQS
jgi:glycosyltransferase involved in cell wall biosynthesis